MDKISKLSIKDQIYILEKAKQYIISGQYIFTCSAIERVIRDNASESLYSFRITDYIPLHNRSHATKLCRLNNIPMPNTTKLESSNDGWWNSSIKEEEYFIQRTKLANIRSRYLEALINELKSM